MCIVAINSHHTFTFESLSYKTKQHLSTIVAKCWRPIGVDYKLMRSNNGLIFWYFC